MNESFSSFSMCRNSIMNVESETDGKFSCCQPFFLDDLVIGEIYRCWFDSVATRIHISHSLVDNSCPVKSCMSALC